MPVQKDMAVWVGNDKTFEFVLWADSERTTPFDLTGSEMVFLATWPGGSLRKSSSTGDVVLDFVTGRVSIPITPAESRAMPPGSRTRYEIERRIDGTETTLIYGTVVVSDWGGNDDV